MRPPTCPGCWPDAVDWDHCYADACHAQHAGLDVEDYREAAAVRLTELVGGAVRMRLWEDGLKSWLDAEQGLFETAYGVGTTSGTDDLVLRAEIEVKMLGVAAHADDPDRPRYGYARGSAENDRALNHYGKILVRLRHGFQGRATIVLGDSIGSTKEGGWECFAPEPLGQPGLRCRFSSRDVVAAQDLADACDPDYRYAEVQIYGPVQPGDIEEVVFCGGVPATDDLRLALGNWDVIFSEIPGYLE